MRYRSLYAAGPKAYFEVVSCLSNNYHRVLVVGHNPDIEELVEIITGAIQTMPTCSLAYLKLQINKWSEMDYETTKGQLLDKYLV